MAAVLAKVTARVLDSPRGPDVVHRIRVKRGWFDAGELVEFEVPRNLTCAACQGGGCDVCGRAGAISTRSRQAPAEVLRVKLPSQKPEEVGLDASVILRIPEQGGLAPDGSALPRGVLLLRVDGSDAADASVRRVVPSVSPLVAVAKKISVRPASPRAWARLVAFVFAAVVVFWLVRALLSR